MRRISSKDDLELITERREKREVTFKNVNGHCSRVKAPDLDKNGLPIVVFRNNNDFDTLYNRSCVDQRESTDLHSEGMRFLVVLSNRNQLRARNLVSK